MYDVHAQTLQRQALRALADLRGWLWAQHGHLLPQDLAGIDSQQVERLEAYLDWFDRIDQALCALDVAGERAQRLPLASACSPAEALAPQTVRLPDPCPPTVRSVTSHLTISIVAPSLQELPLSA